MRPFIACAGLDGRFGRFRTVLPWTLGSLDVMEGCFIFVEQCLVYGRSCILYVGMVLEGFWRTHTRIKHAVTWWR